MKAKGQGVGQDVLEEVFFPTGLRQRTYHRLINAEQAENPAADPERPGGCSPFAPQRRETVDSRV